MKIICLKWEFLVAWIVILLTILVMESCVHEPLVSPSDPVVDPPPVNTETCDENTVYFQNDILPLLVSNCAKSGCHDEQTAEEGIVLNSFSNIQRSGVIEAGDPGDSELYERITESDPDDRMPPPPNQALKSEQIALIRTWIAQGAQNNACNSTSCDVTDVTYSGSILPLITNKCIGCHSGNTPSGNLNFTQFDQFQSVALNGRLIGAVTHADGYTPMPRGGAKLSECEIDMIQIWINNSAPND